MSASTVPSRRSDPKPLDPWMSVREAARLLGISPPAVRTRVIKGQLVAQTVADRVFISRASVDAMIAAEDH